MFEGYGPNIEAIRTLKAAGASLLVTVDCGTTSHEALAEAARLGLSTIVIDPQGRIYKWYPTNDWTPDQLLADVKQLLQQSPQGKPHA